MFQIIKKAFKGIIKQSLQHTCTSANKFRSLHSDSVHCFDDWKWKPTQKYYVMHVIGRIGEGQSHRINTKLRKVLFYE